MKTTFAALQEFLLQLRFTMTRVADSHYLFDRADVEAWIALRLYEPDELVGPAALATVRHTLDAFGILDRDQFDDQLREHTLAG